jgi:hypothetical protein
VTSAIAFYITTPQEFVGTLCALAVLVPVTWLLAGKKKGNHDDR